METCAICKKAFQTINPSGYCDDCLKKTKVANIIFTLMDNLTCQIANDESIFEKRPDYFLRLYIDSLWFTLLSFLEPDPIIFIFFEKYYAESISNLLNDGNLLQYMADIKKDSEINKNVLISENEKDLPFYVLADYTLLKITQGPSKPEQVKAFYDYIHHFIICCSDLFSKTGYGTQMSKIIR